MSDPSLSTKAARLQPLRARMASVGLGALLALPACGDGTGVVELSWVFTDRDGEPMFPGGVNCLSYTATGRRAIGVAMPGADLARNSACLNRAPGKFLQSKQVHQLLVMRQEKFR